MAVSTPVTKLGIRQAKPLVMGILDLFTEFGKPNTKVDFSKLSHFFAPSLVITSNENRVTRNLREFEDRIKDIQTRFPTITYSKLLENPIVSGNKVVIRYNAETLDVDDNPRVVNIIAILTVEDGKVVQWTEVLHEKHLSEIDS